jgi:thiol-disulfide isomerase/thioredoxin
MKKIILLIAFLAAACQSTPKKDAVPLPVEIQTASDGEQYIEGPINRQNLLTSPLSTWFEVEYNKFYVNPQWVADHQGLLEGVHLKLFLGTWCEDSEREVPGMFKLLDALGMEDDQIEVYAMNKDKITTANYEKDLDIFNIPTLIVYKNDKEMNRFVELSVVSLTDDLSKILKGQPYEHAYYGF